MLGLQRTNAKSPPDVPPHIVTEIRAAHEQAVSAAATAIDHARRCGELLTTIKGQLPHGAWSGWLAGNFPASERTAQNYMRIAERWAELAAKPQHVADLTVSGALRMLATPRVASLASDLDGQRTDLTSGKFFPEVNQAGAFVPKDGKALLLLRSDYSWCVIVPHVQPGFYYWAALEPDCIGDKGSLTGITRGIRADYIGRSVPQAFKAADGALAAGVTSIDVEPDSDFLTGLGGGSFPWTFNAFLFCSFDQHLNASLGRRN